MAGGVPAKFSGLASDLSTELKAILFNYKHNHKNQRDFRRTICNETMLSFDSPIDELYFCFALAKRRHQIESWESLDSKFLAKYWIGQVEELQNKKSCLTNFSS